MGSLDDSKVTELLLSWGRGDVGALDRLVPLVYDELRRLAHHHMRRERAGHSLQTTALVNEAYLRLVDYRRVQPQDRVHCLSISAQAMRRILVERARGRAAAKRGAGAAPVSLDAAGDIADQRAAELVALDDALAALAAMAPRQARVVELRYFGGLTGDETAEVLGVSAATVERDFTAARIWLRRELDGGGAG